MTASPSPLRPSALALLLTAAVAGALCTAAVAAAPSTVRTPLAWFSVAGVLLLGIAAFAVTWTTRAARLLRARVSGLTGEVSARDAEISRLTAQSARDAAARTAERQRLTGEHAAELERFASAGAAEADRLTASHLSAREHLGEQLRRAESGRAAAMAAAANAAGRMQALATGMLADLREMEHRHADEDVLGDLLHLDHRTAQAGRLADSIAVLTGARSGRRWAKPIVMESILRGAMGRIGSYQRVRLHSTSEAAIAGHAAEGVMHALAELLDNAANFSPPTAEVHVYVEEVPAGIIITVEDSGLVMSEVQLRRAEQAVTAESLDLAGLSGTRLGLAVVGRLARKHGLTVSFRPSARGGTGALMMLPQELISQGPAANPAAEGGDPLPIDAAATVTAAEAAVVTPAAPSPAEHGGARTGDSADAGRAGARTDPERAGDRTAEDTGDHPAPGESGLPQRRRGRTLAAAHPEGAGAADRAAARTSAPADASRSAARFGSFRQAVRGAAAEQPTGPTHTPHPPHPEGNTR
ncbi:ATP-binding protein [Streptomyces sp. NBC_00536]|uniref:sensor histidine kinase n=1 Tax=Streptomyces sp. NBC_00536 TaxID=2975769 RepID=UPI002E8152FA|nr:ATP-binding protein [Streptomyces sp. NBC_00536]WUC77819.1 ATP-binding protein [Streptomyces sp. NBC_00536]